MNPVAIRTSSFDRASAEKRKATVSPGRGYRIPIRCDRGGRPRVEVVDRSNHRGRSRSRVQSHRGRARTRDCRARRRNDVFFEAITHYVYGGDTPLHAAAACYGTDIVATLLARGADVAARNRRGAQPLHYAADGHPESAGWNPEAQQATITELIDAGADPNARDKSGVSPLHRAVRTRCAAAVAALIAGGADPTLPNLSGSTPLDLAQQPTGRGGSGSDAAHAQQAEIIRLLQT
jgi:hypothetical protein